MRFLVEIPRENCTEAHLCNIKHKKQTLADFQNDCHRFSLWHNGNVSEVQCYGLVDVLFDDETIPNDVKCEVQEKVWELIDKNDHKWAVPKSAQEIANEYCVENFFYQNNSTKLMDTNANI